MILKMLFYFFAAILLYAAVRVVSSKGPVQAVLHLVLAFVSSSALWMLIQAEFLALSLIVVYVGAVMVLFLFVVMMLDVDKEEIRKGFIRHLPQGIVVGLIIAVELVFVLAHKQGFFANIDVNAIQPVTSNTRELGMLLYTKYLYPFEVAAVILLVAMIAAISLTHRKPRAGNKTISVEQQLSSNKANSMRIVSGMKAETLEEWIDLSKIESANSETLIAATSDSQSSKEGKS